MVNSILSHILKASTFVKVKLRTRIVRLPTLLMFEVFHQLLHCLNCMCTGTRQPKILIFDSQHNEVGQHQREARQTLVLNTMRTLTRLHRVMNLAV